MHALIAQTVLPDFARAFHRPARQLAGRYFFINNRSNGDSMNDRTQQRNQRHQLSRKEGMVIHRAKASDNCTGTRQ